MIEIKVIENEEDGEEEEEEESEYFGEELENKILENKPIV
jgi:hypothetical protein